MNALGLKPPFHLEDRGPGFGPSWHISDAEDEWVADFMDRSDAERLLAHLNSPPSLIAWVPEGWVLVGIHRLTGRVDGQQYLARLFGPLNDGSLDRTGYGPTPEAAVQDAASKVTPAADKEGG